MTTTYRMPRPGTQQHRVFAMLRGADAPMTHAAIVAETGLTGPQVSQALFWMIQSGLVDRTGDSKPYRFALAVRS